MRVTVLAVILSSIAWARDPLQAVAPPRGTIEKDVVHAAIHQKLEDVQRCAEASLLENPGTLPKVVVEFVIGVDGKIGDAHLVGTPPPDAAYGQCLLEVVRSLKLKKKPRGGPVTVTYPFTLCGV